MSTALPPITKTTAAELAELSRAAIEVYGSAESGDGNLMAALDAAASIEALRQMFERPEIRQRILALQDTKLGFRTDRPPGTKNKKTNEPVPPYPWPTVRDCALEAVLRGVQLVGNQFNIISYSCYITQEGFDFKIKKEPEISEFKHTLGIPSSKQGGVIIVCEAEWFKGGKAKTRRDEIPVKSDDYSGADQLLGKAKRKFLKRCYEQMSGKSLPDGEAGDETTIEVQATPTVEVKIGKAAKTQTAITDATETKPEPKEPATPPKTATKILGEFLADWGVPFDDFRDWLKGSGRVTEDERDVLATVEDLPTLLAAELVADNCKAMGRCATIYGTKKP